MKGTQHTWQQSALVTKLSESQAGGAWLVAKKGGGHTTTSLIYASPKSASFESEEGLQLELSEQAESLRQLGLGEVELKFWEGKGREVV